MTDQQFTTLCRLARLRGGASEEAAREVMVNGARLIDAARALSLKPQRVSNALRRLRAAQALAQQVL